MKLCRVTAVVAAAGVASVAVSLPARADSVADFYAGKRITIQVAVGAGVYDLYARVLAGHLARHIPGKPSIIVQNMPGAGGAKAANYIQNIAPRDGTMLLVPLKPVAMAQVLWPDKARYNAAEFRWIGSMVDAPGVIVLWKSAPAKTHEDTLKIQTVLASSGKSAETYINPVVLNAVLGTKYKVIIGYTGMQGMQLAVERGEVHGISTVYGSLTSTRPDWVAERKINYIVQIAMKRQAALPDVPTVMELAKTDEQKQIFEFLCLPNVLGRAIAAPPQVPDDRVAALRAAFDATMKDPEFLAEAKKRDMELNPTSGAEVQASVEKLVATPPAIVEKFRKIIE